MIIIKIKYQIKDQYQAQVSLITYTILLDVNLEINIFLNMFWGSQLVIIKQSRMKLDQKQLSQISDEESQQFKVHHIAKRQKKMKRKGRKIISNSLVFIKNSDGTEQIKIIQDINLIKVQREDKIKQKATKFQKKCDQKSQENLLPHQYIIRKNLTQPQHNIQSFREQKKQEQRWNMVPICFYSNLPFSNVANSSFSNFVPNYYVQRPQL